jgi:predicted molibdopterin-dependent oxidoreductase YjgC
MAKIPLPKPGPWELELVPSVCPGCGIGCNIQLNVKGDRISKVTSPVGSPVNNGNLCRKGVFDYIHFQDLKRIKTPLIKRDGNLVQATWEEAIAIAGQGLKQVKDRSGGDRLAVLASRQLTNEEGYLAQKLARAAWGTNNIGAFIPPALQGGLAKSFGQNASTCSYNDILSSDLILIFGCDVDEEYPIIALKIREAVGKGSKLAMINPRATRMDPLTEINLKVNPRTNMALLRSMLNHIITHDLVDQDFVQSQTTGFKDFAMEMRRYPLEEITDALWIKPSKIIQLVHLYIRAKRPVVIVNAEKITSSELTLINDLALIAGNVGRDGAGIIALHAYGNAQGLIDMGVSPHYLPGQQPITDMSARQRFEAAWHTAMTFEGGRDATGIIEGVEKGEVHGILAIGGGIASEAGRAIFEVPLYSVLIDTVLPEMPPYPDVILPGAALAESEGTFTNCERRVQCLRRATPPPAGKENGEIISALATSLGYPMYYVSASEAFAEVGKLAIPTFRMKLYDELLKEGWQWPFLHDKKFGFEDGLARFQLPEVEKVLEA